MLLKIFETLTTALYGNAALALSVSFVWGILSVILSPCHLSSIPLLVAFIGGQGKLPVKKAFFLSGMFALGILLTITIIGIITGLMGKMLGSIGDAPIYVAALIFLLVGLNFIGILPSPDIFKNGTPGIKRKGLFSAFMMGFLFGVVLGPCTFGFAAPVLGVALSSAAQNMIFSIGIILSYALGHCLIIIVAGTFTEFIENVLKLNDKTNISEIFKKVCGVIIILISIYLVLSTMKLI